MLNHNMGKISVQFFRKDHCDRGIDTLTHLGLRHHQCGPARVIDANEGVRRELSGRIVRSLFRFIDSPRRQMEGEQKTAS